MKSKIVLVLLSLMSAGVQAGVIKGKIKCIGDCKGRPRKRNGDRIGRKF